MTVSPFVAIVSEMISILTAGLTGIASGIGSALSNLVQTIFLTGNASDGFTLSVYGGVILAFAGIGLAIGLCRFVVYWLQNLGASHSPK